MFLNTELFGHQRGASNKGYKKIKYGTMVLSTQNLHLGNANVNQRFEHGMVSPAYKTYEITGCSVDLMAQWIKSEAAKRFFYNATTVGASVCRRNVEWDTLYEQPLYLPSIAEQDKLAKFLTLISDRITKQQQYVSSLKKYKRGAIKSLFTQELTLAENTTKWERHKLSDLITLQSGQDFAPSDYNDHGEGIPYMTGASCIVDGKTVVSRWTTLPRCFAYYGDTLLVCKGSGSGAVVMLSQDKVHIARQFMALRPHKMMTKGFCFYLTLHLSEKMKQSATGLIEGIDRKTVLNQDVLLPSIMEQEQIVSFLSAIEKSLLTHELILKSLVSTKKGLMQQLFI
jgi:type I restriction enzyme S subunit